MWLISGMGWMSAFLPGRRSHTQESTGEPKRTSELAQRRTSELAQTPDHVASRASSRPSWSDPPEIGRLADAVVAGDDVACKTIWNHYCGMLMVRLARHPHIRESEDCAQAILMEVYRRRVTEVCQIFDRKRAFLPLLMKALEFAIQDHVRHCRGTGTHEALLADPLVAESMTSADPDVETLLIQEEKRVEARNTLIKLQEKLFKELNELEYAFYVLHYCEGLSIQEGGRLVGKTLDQAKAINEKIRRKCREFLKELKENK